MIYHKVCSFLVFLIFFDNKEVCNDDKYSKYALQQGTLSLTNNIQIGKFS